MTSTKSSFNLTLLLDSCRRRWWMFVVCAIGLFFAYPFAYLLMFQASTGHGYYSGEGTYQYLGNFFGLVGGTGFITIGILAVFAAIISPLIVFSYLHSKKQVNFYHSQPVKRESLFFVNYITGALAFLVPMLFNMLLGLVLAGITGVSGYISFPAFFQVMGFLTLFFLISYSLTVLAGVLTGTLFAHVFMMLLLNGTAITVYGINILMSQTFYTTFLFNMNELIPIRLVPFVRMFSLESESLAMHGGETLIYILIGLAITAASLFIYKLRPSEKSGATLVFKPLELPVKAFIVLIGACGMGFSLLYTSGEGFMVFGIFAGGALTHMACEVMFNKDFKCMLKKPIVMLALCLAITAYFGIYYFDVTGHDRYVPDADRTLGVSMSQYGYGSVSSDKYLTESENIEKMIAIAEICVRQNTENGHRAYSDSYSFSSWHGSSTLYFRYEMQNGRQVSRQYNNIDIREFSDLYAEIFNSHEWKYAEYSELFAVKPGFLIDTLSLYSVRGSGEALNYSHNSVNPNSSPSDLALVEALKSDLLNLKFEDLNSSSPIGTLYLRYKNEGDKFLTTVREIEILDSFKNTITILKEHYGLKDFEVAMEEAIESIDGILIVKLYEGAVWPEEFKESAVWIDDKDAVRSLYRGITTHYYGSSNLTFFEAGYRVAVFASDPSSLDYYDYMTSKEEWVNYDIYDANGNMIGDSVINEGSYVTWGEIKEGVISKEIHSFLENLN